LDDLALVVDLESGSGVLSGLIVRHQHIDALVTAMLRNLAEDLMDLVVLVRGYIEERAAFLARIAGGAGIRADQERLGIGDRLVNCLQGGWRSLGGGTDALCRPVE